MPLPEEGTRWPPANLRAAELNTYTNLYAARTVNTHPDTPPEADPDLGHPVASNPTDSRRARGNLAADICSTAAAALVGTGITLTPPDGTANAENTRSRLHKHAARLNTAILEGAELASLHGDVYYIATADPAAAPHPHITPIDALRVLPVFAGANLTAATYWTDLQTDHQTVWRYVEHRNNRSRRILRGLYKGSPTNLGDRQPLDRHPSTDGLEDESEYPAGVDRMIWHVPNLRPNRRSPQSPYGRSDLQGSESLLAAYDLTLTALMRSVRLSQPQIVVPEGALDPFGPGQTGYHFDEKRELYTTLEIAPETGFTLYQSDIRAAEHLDTLRYLAGKIADNAGLSRQTVGLGDYGNVTSGAALRTLLERTVATVEAKRRTATPVLEDAAATLLQLDRTVFGEPVDPVTPTVEWPPVISDDKDAQAARLETLQRARAISTRTAVKQVNPGMDDADVDEEVLRILAENGLAEPAGPTDDGETPAPGF